MQNAFSSTHVPGSNDATFPVANGPDEEANGPEKDDAEEDVRIVRNPVVDIIRGQILRYRKNE